MDCIKHLTYDPNHAIRNKNSKVNAKTKTPNSKMTEQAQKMSLFNTAKDSAVSDLIPAARDDDALSIGTI
jgi:hypothetical protein